MGAKAKNKKEKNRPKSAPEIDPNEVVTELEKQIFLIQLQDIDKKIVRLGQRQEELKAKTQELEEEVEAFKKENDAIISEEEQKLIMKEEEKIQKREESIRLTSEIKIRVAKHKKHIEELKERQEQMIQEMTQEVETLTEQARILDDFKNNKDSYLSMSENMQKHLAEAEEEHQRILFSIERKGEIAKQKLHKELEFRLLALSIEFQNSYNKKIGDSCRRMTLENKAVETEIKEMKLELADSRDKHVKAVNNVQIYKFQKAMGCIERDQDLARIILQKVVIKALQQDRLDVIAQINAYLGLENEHKLLIKRLKSIENEIQKQISKMQEIDKAIEEKIENTNLIIAATKMLKTTWNRLQLLTKNSLKIIEEAVALKLIPAGGMEGEKLLTNEAKVRLFKKRRESVFNRKGKVLKYLLEFLAGAQLNEDEKKLINLLSTEPIDLEELDFLVVSGQLVVREKESDEKEPYARTSEADKLSGRWLLSSDMSLPRSVSEIIYLKEEEDEESMEGEGEEEDDDQQKFNETEKIADILTKAEVEEGQEETKEDETSAEEKEDESSEMALEP